MRRPAAQFPVFDRAPLYLRETLLFPYTQGMLFQHAVVEKMDKAAFSEVFRRPPSNTQQILHPEKYFDRVKAPRPELPVLATDAQVSRVHGWRSRRARSCHPAAAVCGRGSGRRRWRRNGAAAISGCSRAAEGSAGDAPPTVLVYASEWSGLRNRRARFFGLYQKVLAGKWKRFEVESSGEDVITGRGDDGYFLLRREGTRVSSVEGLASLDEVQDRSRQRGAAEIH